MLSRISKPWGYEILWAHTDKYVGKVLHINAGHSLSLQYHATKDETIMVQTGRIQLEYYSRKEGKQNKHVLDMVPGDNFHITPGLRHRMIACQDADIIEVSTPELTDVVRIEDRYGRSRNGGEEKQKRNFVIRFFGWLGRKIRSPWNK